MYFSLLICPSESPNLLIHLLYFSSQLLYSALIISSFFILITSLWRFILRSFIFPEMSKYLLFTYFMGPLGLVVSFALSSCLQLGLHSTFGMWASHKPLWNGGAQALGCMSSIAMTCRFSCPATWDLSSQAKGWTLVPYIVRKILTNDTAGKTQ